MSERTITNSQVSSQDAFFSWDKLPVCKVFSKRVERTRFLRANQRKRRLSPEADMQSAFFYWLGYQYPDLRLKCFAIPNGGSRNILEARSLQKQGVTPGVPDVICCLSREPYHGLFIEFKAGKNSLTPTQKQMFERFKKEGYRCEVCYTSEAAMDIFKDYIGESIKKL